MNRREFPKVRESDSNCMLAEGSLACMGHCLFDDLRMRVVSEVQKGCSCRAAGVRFGVSASSAIRWVQAFVDAGLFWPTPKLKAS